MTASKSSPRCDNPIIEYNRLIQSGEIAACTKLKAMYAALVKDIEQPRDQWEYDEDRANHAITFIERYCKHSKGRWGGKPVVLELWQRAFVAAAFGFIDVETGFRRFQDVLLIVARKNGKSTLASAIALYLMIADGEAGAEIYAAATKKDQAKIVWLEAKRMVKKSPALIKRIKPLVAEMDGVGAYDGCVFKPLGADSETLDGLNVHGAMMDEIHAWPDMDLYNVIVDGETARDQPMNVYTTTAGTVRNGLYDELYGEAANMLAGTDGFGNDRLLAVIYELDSDAEIWDEKTWQKANPGLGTIKDATKLREKVEKARANKRRLPNLLCKDFDRISAEDESWLTYDEIDNDAAIDIEELRGCYAIGGCDLSSTIDLTCATLIMRKTEADEHVYVLQHYFVPESKVEELERDGKVREAPYRVWGERGLLTICPGKTVDFREVTNWFCKMRDEYEIIPMWIGYDRALAGYWLQDMDEHGFTYMGKQHPANVLEQVAQGAYTWSQPMKEMGAALAEKKVVYNNNPILKWCLLNTRKKSRNADGIESIEPKKIRESQRIDGTVSMLNAWVVYVRRYEEYMGYVARLEW